MNYELRELREFENCKQTIQT